MYSVYDNHFIMTGFPHSEISGYNACLSAYPSLSQTSTSFIAFCRLGIHRMHLVTWPYNPKKSLSCLFCVTRRCTCRSVRHIQKYVPLLTLACASIDSKNPAKALFDGQVHLTWLRARLVVSHCLLRRCFPSNQLKWCHVFLCLHELIQ